MFFQLSQRGTSSYSPLFFYIAYHFPHKNIPFPVARVNFLKHCNSFFLVASHYLQDKVQTPYLDTHDCTRPSQHHFPSAPISSGHTGFPVLQGSLWWFFLVKPGFQTTSPFSSVSFSKCEHQAHGHFHQARG